MEEKQGNKLVALFMGAFYKSWKDNRTNRYRFDKPIGETYAFLARDLKYHTSWDWLMPVVEKIEELASLQYWIELSGRRCTIYEMVNYGSNGKVIISEYGSTNSESKIHATWLAITDFIQWYNQSQQTLNQ
jgi:hypothetical protein